MKTNSSITAAACVAATLVMAALAAGPALAADSPLAKRKPAATVVSLSATTTTAESRPDERLPAQVGRWSWRGPRSGLEHWVQVPEKYHPAVPWRMLVMFHGPGDSAARMIESETCRQALERGWLVVAPGWSPEKSDAAQAADEAAILTGQIVLAYCIDRQMVVVSGAGDGGAAAIRGFTRYPDLFTHLVTHGSPFNETMLAPAAIKVRGAERRPVLALWGEKESDAILLQGPRLRNWFADHGHPASAGVVPGAGRAIFSRHAWSWLDALAAEQQAGRLAEIMKVVGRFERPGGEPLLAQVLGPFQGLGRVGGAPGTDAAGGEKTVDDNGDPFLKEWDGRYNAIIRATAEPSAAATALHERAVGAGRRQLGEIVMKLNLRRQDECRPLVMKFNERWRAVPELCREAAAAYEKTYGEKLPDGLP